MNSPSQYIDMTSPTVPELSTAARVVQEVFTVLNTEGIAFCVLHGYEFLPHAWGSDIDILVSGSVTAEAIEKLLIRHEDRLGAKLIRRERLHFTLACNDHQGVPEFIILDFTHDVFLGRCLLHKGEDILSGRRMRGSFWVPAAGLAFDIQFLRALIKDRFSPFRTTLLSLLYAEGRDQAREYLLKRWSRPYAELIESAAATGNWNGVVDCREKLRRRFLISSSVSSPLATLTRAVRENLARVERLIRPRGLHVAFLGPDGAGKSSTIEAIEAGLKPLFSRIEVRGFAPSLRQAVRPAPVSTADPHSRPPRSYAVSLLRAGFWAVYGIFSHLSLRWAKARSRLVLSDRYFVDILIDPVRYRYGGPTWALKLVWWIMPKPDLLVLLSGSPEIIQARKKEISLEQTRRLCCDYEHLVESLPYGAVVDNTEPINETVHNIVNLIFRKFRPRSKSHQ